MTTVSEPAFSGHSLKLDGLRAVAVSLVLIHHFGYTPRWLDLGYYGVDLFFIISGFLITSILIRNGPSFGRSYRTFLGRRTLRIFPVYYLALAILYAFNFSTVRHDIGFLASYTWNYAQNRWHDSEIFYFWSLSTEEQFYLFWPFIALALRRRLKILFAVTCIIVAVGYAQLLCNLFPTLSPFNYTGLVNRMGSLGLGGLGAIALQLRFLPRWFYRSLPLEIALFIILFWTQYPFSSIRFPIMGVCSLCFVLKAVSGDFRVWGVSRFLESKPATFLGKISYGIYICHWPVGFAFTKYVFDPIWRKIPFDHFGPLAFLRWHSWAVKLPLYSLLSVAVATASYYFFERKILALKERIFPACQPTVPAPAPEPSIA